MPFDPQWFPNVNDANHTPKSPKDDTYNCVAWAAGEDLLHWWPRSEPNAHWPREAQNEETIEAFIDAFRTLGYAPCDDGEFEEGVEKVAIYALGEKPKHAARQVGPDLWWSKMGRQGIDMHHTLAAVEGPSYGVAVRFVSRRQLPSPSPASGC